MSDREKTQEIKEATKEAFKISNIEQESEKTYSVTTPNIINSEDYMGKLKMLQEELQREVNKNPNIQLTDEYKKIQEKYEQIINPTAEENTKKEEQEIIIEDKPNTNNSADELQEQENDEKITTNEETTLNVISEEPKIQEEPNQVVEEEKTPEVITEEKINEQEMQDKLENQDKEIEYTENEPQKIDIEESDVKQEENGQVEEEKNDLENANEKILSFEQMYRQLFGKEPYGGRKQPEEKNYYTIDTDMEDSNVSMFEDNTEYKKLEYKIIGIAFNTYIILEIEDELYIMDQHAAHERIMYEKVKKNFYDQNEKSSQLLLLPDIIELTNKEMAIAKDNFELFRQAGFTLEEFGENTIKLSGVPEICIDLNTRDLFKETLDEINTVARTAKQEKEEKFIATVACKAAVKANMKLEKQEVEKLMEKLLELPNPFTCPHGRPTVIKMSKYEIERKFARK